MRYTISFDLFDTDRYPGDPWDDIYCLVHATGGRRFKKSDEGNWCRFPDTTVDFVSAAEKPYGAVKEFVALVDRVLGIPRSTKYDGAIHFGAVRAASSPAGGFLYLVDPPGYATGTKDEARAELNMRLEKRGRPTL